jgi:hypothetical protein
MRGFGVRMVHAADGGCHRFMALILLLLHSCTEERTVYTEHTAGDAAVVEAAALVKCQRDNKLHIQLVPIPGPRSSLLDCMV